MFHSFANFLSRVFAPLPEPRRVVERTLHITHLHLLDAQLDLETAEERVVKLQRRIHRLETYLDPEVRELR